MGRRFQGLVVGVVVGALLAGGIAYAVTVIPADSTDRSEEVERHHDAISAEGP
jgi:hypothetical protein